MITVRGKKGVKATILAHSINARGHHFLTWEVEYPRLVLAELNTHKMLSKNSFSSRAVPFPKMVQQLTGEPIRFGANQAGMQDKGDDFDAPVWISGQSYTPQEAWRMAKDNAVYFAQAFYEAGYHKQVYNRLLESWQMMKTVLSGTETDNFFWLRNHGAADPTLEELARCMNEAKEQSVPDLLRPGEWHLPYIKVGHTGINSTRVYALDEEYMAKGIYMDVDDAIKVSCARCAAVSYRNEGYDLEKSLQVYENLVGGDRKHASAFEHCATPIKATEGAYLNSYDPRTWEEGVTHMDRDGGLWSGNLKGFIQFRKLIPGENYVRSITST